MSGSSLRLRRLFDATSHRSFMVAFDRTLAGGPEPYAVDSAATVTAIAAAGADAILLSPGLIKQHGHLLAYRGGPAIVCRVDFPFIAGFARGRGEEFRVIARAEEAVALGADALVMFLILGHEEQRTWGTNVEAVARTAEAARRVGVPLIVEAVPWGSQAPDPRDPQLVATAVRIAAELGADAVKTEYVGDLASMRDVVAGCPVPVLVLGGPTVDDVGALVGFTADALAAGARGVIYGRNVWQRTDSALVSARLRAVVHGGADAT
ncbi:class I fructose-bisphosphate aldolase [Pengzhenrongella sicca]|uniref:Fructose-bisphosphate aldolase n=1 Tax=Pengzhenrongella sicca TaxID=2819238 RepID=A0A8A4Z908_9MICO|nr:hypothetical protein [Pengzhenrongella sicca]QTE27955.1 hypothetical protein J4E96_11100 [Pengzhenrongella sicca]